MNGNSNYPFRDYLRYINQKKNYENISCLIAPALLRMLENLSWV